MAQADRPDPAQGVFETLLVHERAPVELAAHLERLAGSVRELYGAELPDGLEEALRERCAGLALGRLRVALQPAPAGELRAELLTAAVDAGNVFPGWERAIGLAPFTLEGGLGAHKWADRSWLERTQHGESADSAPLILDTGGEALEASRANVFALEQGRLVTPPTDGRILPGVARAQAIEAALAAGLEVSEESLAVERLAGAECVFLTNSIRGVEPVRAIGESALPPPAAAVQHVAEHMRRAWLEQTAARG